MLLRHVRGRDSRRHLRALLHRDRRRWRDRSTRAARWLRPVLDVDVVRGGNHGVRRMWSSHRVVHLTLGLWHRVGDGSFRSWNNNLYSFTDTFDEIVKKVFQNWSLENAKSQRIRHLKQLTWCMRHGSIMRRGWWTLELRDWRCTVHISYLVGGMHARCRARWIISLMFY